MHIRFSCHIQSILLIGSVLMLTSCATPKTDEAITSKTDETSRLTIEKGKLETPPEIRGERQMNAPAAVIEPLKSTSEAAPNTGQAVKANITRIKPNEPFVNVRTAPSIKSRNLAVLKAGQKIEVLDTKQNWLKIKWQIDDVVKHGWINKRFVEGFEP